MVEIRNMPHAGERIEYASDYADSSSYSQRSLKMCMLEKYIRGDKYNSVGVLPLTIEISLALFMGGYQ